MHVIVVGCGRVGARLATILEDDGHSVAVVDRRAASFTRLADNFAGDRVVGVGFDRDLLRAAGVEHADAVIAVTGGDNSNILVARVARDAFGVDRVVARIYDPRRAEIYERLGIPTVATVRWTTERILRHVVTDGSAAPGWTDPTATVELVERIVPPTWAAHRLGELEQRSGARAVAVARNGTTFLAEDTTVLQDGDTAWFAVDRVGVEKLETALHADLSDKGAH
ncbi:MAG: TrkA family potassium uptake protein [Actinobacteria bacterium]|nr:TrkA family potassium uptake protein [Actinomycetota bacterium]